MSWKYTFIHYVIISIFAIILTICHNVLIYEITFHNLITSCIFMLYNDITYDYLYFIMLCLCCITDDSCRRFMQIFPSEQIFAHHAHASHYLHTIHCFISLHYSMLYLFYSAMILSLYYKLLIDNISFI